MLDRFKPWLHRRPDAVVSFPKSGRTWLRVMLDECNIRLLYTHAGAEHKTSVHFGELNTLEAESLGRIVFLYRDPRDTAVSGYYQVARRLGGYPGTISDFIRDPRHGVAKILHYNAMWLDLAKTRPHVLVIRYEDMQADASAVLSRVVEFLGRAAERAAIEATVENNTFEKMRERERSGDYRAQYGDILLPADPGDPNSFKVRRGQVANYRDELSAEDIAYCDAVSASFVEAYA